MVSRIHRRPCLVDQRRELLVAARLQFDEELERAAGSEDGYQVVERERDEDRPRGPLGKLGEPRGNDDAEADRVALAEQDREAAAGKDGEDSDDGEVEEEEKGGDGVEGDGEAFQEGEEDGSAHGGEDEEGGEAGVVEEEGGAVVVVEEDEAEGCERDDRFA